MQGTEGAPSAQGCPKGLVQGVESAVDEDLDSNDKSLRERMLKIITEGGRGGQGHDGACDGFW